MTEEFEGLKSSPRREAAQRITRRHFLAARRSAVLAQCAARGVRRRRLGAQRPCGLAGGELEDRAQHLPLGRVRRSRRSSTTSPTKSAPATTIDDLRSNEQAIAKLDAAAGDAAATTSSCRRGVYIPQMVELRPARADRPSNDPELRERRGPVPRPAVGPRQRATPCARTGAPPGGSSTRRRSSTTDRHLEGLPRRRRMGEASGNMSVLDAPGDIAGDLLLGERDRLGTTEDTADHDACEDFMVNEFAPHIKAFDSYPGDRADRRATTPSRRSGTATRARGLPRRAGRTRTLRVGPRAARRPSSGWTTGAS